MSAASDVAAALAERVEALAVDLVGEEPTYRGRHEWRFYPRGGLSIEIAGDRRGIWCHHGAGGRGGDALDLVAHLRECRLADAIAWARAWLGQRERVGRPAAPRPTRTEPALTMALARRVWTEGTDPAGSPVDIYLRSRGLSPPAYAPLRFHPACPRGAERLPAMLALMTDPVTNRPLGVHRTFLASAGRGKAAGRTKMMVGHAGIIRLVPDNGVTRGLGVAEGIETSLAVMQHAGWLPVWACASAGGISRFPVLGGIEALTIFTDRDDKGAGFAAAKACAERWVAAGREATIALPPGGTDWLNALLPRRTA